MGFAGAEEVEVGAVDEEDGFAHFGGLSVRSRVVLEWIGMCCEVVYVRLLEVVISCGDAPRAAECFAGGLALVGGWLWVIGLNDDFSCL